MCQIRQNIIENCATDADMSGFSDPINQVLGRALKRRRIRASSLVWRTPLFPLAPGDNRQVFRFVRLVNLPSLYRIAGNSRIVCKALRQCQIRQRDMTLDTLTRGTKYYHEKCNDLTGDH